MKAAKLLIKGVSDVKVIHLSFYPRVNMKFEQNRYSESFIQCELYHLCRIEGIEAYPEYSCFVNGQRCRFDLVIICDDEIVMIIECKSRSHRKVNLKTKQYQKYKQTGLPIIYYVNVNMIKQTMTKIKVELIKYRKTK